MSFSDSRCNCGKRKTRGSLVCDACAKAEADGGDMACYLNADVLAPAGEKTPTTK